MIQLTFLNGSAAGKSLVAKRFPFLVGRQPTADLRLEEPGVWDQHLEFTVPGFSGVVVRANPAALTLLNGQPVQQARLRSGDVLELGHLRLRFELSPTRQRQLRLREGLTWVAWALLAVVQILLLYALSP